VVREMSRPTVTGAWIDLLAVLDSSVLDADSTRPGLSRYSGHRGVQQLMPLDRRVRLVQK